MNIAETIEKKDFHLSPDDRLGTALEIMERLGFNALPVVEDGILSGLLRLGQLQEPAAKDLTLAEAGLSYAQIYLFAGQPVFDALPVVAAQQVNVVPVITEKHEYAGMMTWTGLIHAINQLLDCERPGSMLVLEVGHRDNALSHIAHIIESADAQVLSSFTRPIPDSTRLEITLKISGTSLSSVVAALLRHDYHVKTTYNNELDKEDLHARFEHLMNYINM